MLEKNLFINYFIFIFFLNNDIKCILTFFSLRAPTSNPLTKILLNFSFITLKYIKELFFLNYNAGERIQTSHVKWNMWKQNVICTLVQISFSRVILFSMQNFITFKFFSFFIVEQCKLCWNFDYYLNCTVSWMHISTEK